MASSSESHQESGNPEINQQFEIGKVNNTVTGTFNSPYEVQGGDGNSNIDAGPYEPTAAEIERGSNETIAFFEDAVGRRFTTEGMDEETERLLYQLRQDREGWPAALESYARTALQSLFPDNGGSKVHGPL